MSGSFSSPNHLPKETHKSRSSLVRVCSAQRNFRVKSDNGDEQFYLVGLRQHIKSLSQPVGRQFAFPFFQVLFLRCRTQDYGRSFRLSQAHKQEIRRPHLAPVHHTALDYILPCYNSSSSLSFRRSFFDRQDARLPVAILQRKCCIPAHAAPNENVRGYFFFSTLSKYSCRACFALGSTSFIRKSSIVSECLSTGVIPVTAVKIR
jgi:hypothetical protein